MTRSGLVRPYQGQSTQNVKQVAQSAMDGVLSLAIIENDRDPLASSQGAIGKGWRNLLEAMSTSLDARFASKPDATDPCQLIPEDVPA